MKYAIIIIAVCLISSCRTVTDKEKIEYTIHKVLELLKKDDYAGFNKIIYPQVKKVSGEEGFKHDFDLASQYVNKYVKDIDTVHFFYGEINPSLGALLVIIPIFDGFDRSDGTEKVEIDLLFGPKKLFSLYKLSDFSLVHEINVHYAEHIKGG